MVSIAVGKQCDPLDRRCIASKGSKVKRRGGEIHPKETARSITGNYPLGGG